MSSTSVQAACFATSGPRQLCTRRQPFRNRADRAFRLRRCANRQDDQEKDKRTEQASRRIQALQEAEAREELGSWLVYAGAQGLLGLFLCHAFNVNTAQYLLVHPGDLRVALLMAIPLIVIDALLLLPDWEAKVPEASVSQALTGKLDVGTGAVDKLPAALTTAAASCDEQDSQETKSEASTHTSSPATPQASQFLSDASSPVMVDVNVARAAADAKASTAAQDEPATDNAADLSVSPIGGAACSTSGSDSRATDVQVADAVDAGSRKPRVVSPASTLQMLQMLEDQLNEERPATTENQPEAAAQAPKATVSKAPAEADLEAIQAALNLLQSRLVARKRARESMPHWRRVVSKFQDDTFARKVLMDMNVFQEILAVVATSLGKSWLRLAVWLLISGWSADRLTESGIIDNLYLTTGVEIPLSLVCQTAAVGVCFSAVVGWHVGLALYLGQALQDKFQRNDDVPVNAIVLSDKGKGVPKVMNLKDAQKDIGGLNPEANRKMKAMHRKVLSRAVRRQQEQYVIKGARAGAMELLSGLLFVSTGSWVAALMADLLQSTAFSQFQYMEHKHASMGALSADIMKAMAEAGSGTGSIKTTMEGSGKQSDKTSTQSSQANAHASGEAADKAASSTPDDKPHDKAEG